MRRLMVSTACLSLLWAGVGLADDKTPTPPASAAVTEAAWRGQVRTFARDNFKQPAWGFSHSERNYALAKRLAASDGVALDDDVLFAAAYLHDMAAFPTWAKEGVDHADRAAELVPAMLQGWGFPAAKIPAVQGAIRTHMYFRDPVGPEAIYLHDADALDWLGAIGVARIMALVDPKGEKPTGPDAVKLLEDNLAKVPDRVLSPAGKALVPERREELARWLETLRQQTDDYGTF